MITEENKAIVQQMYVAFGRGDVPAILETLADDVEWHVMGSSEVVPWAGTRHGREQTSQFFRAVGETLDVEKFEARTMVAEGDTVVVVGWERSRVKPTNRIYEDEWVHVFRVRQGKIAAFREFNNSAAWLAAYRGA
ncbi:MAG TPA: nuclear transport factor 2 family protein [Microvirga sp.]|jgi:ketosteroid isomerase-like protein|nr:nuclear transport factor 2 family protein [Microvirga sp.]